MICEVTAGHGKKNERQREQSAYHADKLVAFVIGESHPRDQRNDEPFQDVVAERALGLRDEKPPEAAWPNIRRQVSARFHDRCRHARAAVNLVSARCVGM
jgi:hypothetical protein